MLRCYAFSPMRKAISGNHWASSTRPPCDRVSPGSAAARLTDYLRRDLKIIQGKGSVIETRWGPEGGFESAVTSSKTASRTSSDLQRQLRHPEQQLTLEPRRAVHADIRDFRRRHRRGKSSG